MDGKDVVISLYIDFIKVCSIKPGCSGVGRMAREGPVWIAGCSTLGPSEVGDPVVLGARGDAYWGR